MDYTKTLRGKISTIIFKAIWTKMHRGQVAKNRKYAIKELVKLFKNQKGVEKLE